MHTNDTLVFVSQANKLHVGRSYVILDKGVLKRSHLLLVNFDVLFAVRLDGLFLCHANE